MTRELFVFLLGAVLLGVSALLYRIGGGLQNAEEPLILAAVIAGTLGGLLVLGSAANAAFMYADTLPTYFDYSTGGDPWPTPTN
jgi:hypothetical protein